MGVARELAKQQDSMIHAVQSILRQRLGRERMDLWFGASANWSIIGHNTVRIEVASEFLSDCISRMFRQDLQAAVSEIAGNDWGFVIEATVDNKSTPNPSANSVVNLARPSPTRSDSNAVARADDSPAESAAPISLRVVRDEPMVPAEPEVIPVSMQGPAPKDASLEPGAHASSDTGAVGEGVDRLVELRRHNERRWDDFIPGDHNRLAYTAAQMVLERPGQVNPLVIHGPSGTGKTHLSNAIGFRLRQAYRMRRVLMLTAEQFTIEFTDSVRGGGFASFRRKYRDVDAFILDDVQFCIGKAGTLVELRNTIDNLLRDHRQVILVADRSLNELSALGPDLYARLSGGMVCSVDPMDVSTRTRLLQRLCEKSGCPIDTKVLGLIAQQCGGDARVLHGIVHRLVAQQRLVRRNLLDEEVVRCTHDLVRASQPIVRVVDIEKVVCEAFGLDEKALREKSKCQSVSQPRMLAMFLARRYTRTALSEIGEYFGKRQHSTVISAQKKVEQWLESDDMIWMGRGRVSVRDILKSLEATLQVG